MQVSGEIITCKPELKHSVINSHKRKQETTERTTQEVLCVEFHQVCLCGRFNNNFGLHF